MRCITISDDQIQFRTFSDPGLSRVCIIEKEQTVLFRVLFIEGSFEIKESIKDYFMTRSESIFKMDFACDMLDGLDKVRAKSYDLFFVDQKINSGPGLEIFRILRENCPCPVVYITDLGDESEIEQCNVISADDYLFKPFSPSDIFDLSLEYAGRNRSGSAVKVLECSGIRMNTVTGLVTVDGRPAELTTKPAGILRLLLENKNAAVSRDEILKEVWGEDYEGNERVVDNHIKNLRQLLGKKGDLIKTVKGIGYKIREK